MENYHPFDILGIASSSISIIFAVYLGYKMRAQMWKRFQRDVHYRMRFVLVVLLLFNRIMQLTQLVIGGIVKNYVAWNVVLPKYFVWFTLYPIVTILIFLTLDRYRRIMWVGNERFARFFFIVFYCFSAVEWIGAAVDIFFRLLSFNVGHDYWNSVGGNILYVHAVILSLGLFIHYLFTILLMTKCITSDNEEGGFFHLLAVTILHHKEKASISDHISLKAYKRVVSGLKMIGLFLILVMADVVVFWMTMAYSDSISADGMYAFASSWIVVHIFCLFKLLDMFLEALKVANIGNDTSQSGHKRWFHWIRKLGQKPLDTSDTTDIVNLSYSRTKSTPSAIQATKSYSSCPSNTEGVQSSLVHHNPHCNPLEIKSKEYDHE